MKVFRFSTLIRRFRREEHGSATFEALLWIHFFLFFILLVLDASTIFLQNSKIRRIVQDANRQFVAGSDEFDNDPSKLEDWIEAAVSRFAPNATANATLDTTTGLLTTNLTYPSADTELTGLTRLIGISYALDTVTVRIRVVNLTES